MPFIVFLTGEPSISSLLGLSIVSTITEYML